MLAYRLTILIFTSSTIATFLFANELKDAILISLVFLLFIIISVGSAKIQLGFYTKAFCRKKTNDKVIAITFDDGPSENTSVIIKLLEKYGAKGTFFCIGNKVAPHAANLKKMTENGYVIGNHSLQHRSFFPIQWTKTIYNEIKETSQRIQDITNQEVKYFRPPFGVTNPRIARAVKKSELKIIGWSIRSYDTTSMAKETVLNRITKRIKPGEIVLLHDTSSDILWVLENLLIYLNNNNYRAITIEELDNLN